MMFLGVGKINIFYRADDCEYRNGDCDGIGRYLVQRMFKWAFSVFVACHKNTLFNIYI